jgi:hypothetical protein
MPLTTEEVFKRLESANNETIKDAHKIVSDALQFELGRQQRLDAKANALLGAVALALSVAGTSLSPRSRWQISPASSRRFARLGRFGSIRVTDR